MAVDLLLLRVMPLISFDERTKQDLQVCCSVPKEFFSQFCNIALDFLKSGSNRKMFQGAAQKLEVQPKEIEAAVASIARILMDATKSALTQNDLLFSIGNLGLNAELCEILSIFYGEKKEEIMTLLLKAKSAAVPEFVSLDWRLEMEVASRTRHNTFEPSFFMQLGTKNTGDGEPTSLLLECDYANMSHLKSELEAALLELKTQHALRVARYLDV